MTKHVERTFTMTDIKAKDRNNLVTLSTRNVLKIRKDLKAPKFPELEETNHKIFT